ncbi:MAG: zinc-ribbon domain-containing protein [Desulfococcaceae bacterium]
MDIVCEHCRKKLSIPDEKVPKGKTFAITCPECRKKITVTPESQKLPGAAKADPPEKTAGKAEPVPKDTDSESQLPAADDSAPSGNPFEFLAEGARTAMICEMNQQVRTRIREAVEKLEYHILEVATPRDALREMRYHTFDLIVINELFGTRDPDMNHILKYLGQLMMIVRRNIFVAVLSERFRTSDNLQAYNKSVNLFINLKDMDRFGTILEHAINEHDSFYRTFKSLFKEIKGL